MANQTKELSTVGLIEAKAIELLRLHNPSLSFQGFAKVGDATPAHVLNNAWIVSESGPVFGETVVKGQVVWSDGAAFVVDNINTVPDFVKPEGVSFTDALLQVQSDESFFPNVNAWTIEMFVMLRDITTTQSLFDNGIGLPGVGISATRFNLAAYGVAVKQWFYLTANELNKRVFISVTWNGSTHIVKINNAPVVLNTSSSTAYVTAINTFNMGKLDIDLQPANLECYLFRIYNFVVSDSDLTLHYNNGLPHEFQLKKNAGIKLELNGRNASDGVWVDTSNSNLFGDLLGDYELLSGALPVNKIMNEGKSYTDLNRVEKSKVNFTAGLCDFTPNVSLFPNSAWSFEIAVNISDVQALGSVLNCGEPSSHFIYFNNGDLYIGVSGVGNNIKIRATSWVDADVHVVVSFDGVAHKVYVDGVDTSFVLTGSYSYSKAVISRAMVGSYANSSQFLNGAISLMRIWGKALSESEAIASFNSGNFDLKRYSTGADITLELTGENCNGEKWLDSSINKLTGALSGVIETNSNLPKLEASVSVDGDLLSIVPSEIYVAIDRELNLWYDSIIPYYYKQDYLIECLCSEGFTQDRSFRFTPAATGVFPLTISVKDAVGNVIESKTVNINAVSKSAGSGSPQILFIGDSTTDSEPDLYLSGRTKYEMLHEISDLFIADGGATPLFLGLRGVAPYKHQAHSGYSSDLFISNNVSYPNPFWDAANARNDFQKYMSDNANFGGTNTIDYVFIQLGINDLKNGGSASTVINRLITLIGTINDATYGYPSAKIIISQTPYAPINRSGWSLHFFAEQEYTDYVKVMNELAKLVVSTFHENATYANVYVSPNLLFVDREFGYPRELQDVSARSTVQKYGYIDSVHPDLSGYQQAADAYYSRLRSLL